MTFGIKNGLYIENLRAALVEADRMLVRAKGNNSALFTALANEFRLVGKGGDAEAIIRERDAENELINECRAKIMEALK